MADAYAASIGVLSANRTYCSCTAWQSLRMPGTTTLLRYATIFILWHWTSGGTAKATAHRVMNIGPRRTRQIFWALPMLWAGIAFHWSASRWVVTIRCT